MRKIFCVCFTILLLFGCAPGLKNTLRVSSIPAAENSRRNLDGLRLNVGTFKDARISTGIARVNTREVRADGDVGAAVQQAFERQVKIQGAKLSLFNAPTLRGTVKDWKIMVKPAFPSSKADARASLEVELVDTGGKVKYRGTYSGNMSVENPVMREERVEGILGEAMLNAMVHVLNDRRFVSKLRDLSQRPAEEVSVDTRPPEEEESIIEAPPVVSDFAPPVESIGPPASFKNQRPSDVNY